MSGTRALMVFLKRPWQDSVKTRLAAGVGDDEARRIYASLLQRTLQEAAHTTPHLYLYFAEGYPEAEPNSVEYPEAKFRLQQGGDLGSRMLHAFTEVHQNHRSVIIIGSDCPEISAELLNSAFEKLEYVDLVIGPTSDGGYYLLGANSTDKNLFEGIEWSSPRVFRKTLEKIISSRVDFSILRTLDDIDTKADWIRYRNQADA